MAVTKASSFSQQSIARFAEGEWILLNDPKELIETQNLQYALAGSRVGGIVFDPVFTTTSTTVTQVNSTSGGRNLNTWWGYAVCNRRGRDGVKHGRYIGVTARLKNAKIDIDVYQGELYVDTIVIDNRGGGWATQGEAIYMEPGGDIGDKVILRAFVSVTSGTGIVAQLSAWELELAASELPNVPE